MSPIEKLTPSILRTAALAFAVFYSAACAAPPSSHPQSQTPSKEVDVSEKDHMPHDAGPRPPSPVCPPGMVGSCR